LSFCPCLLGQGAFWRPACKSCLLTLLKNLHSNTGTPGIEDDLQLLIKRCAAEDAYAQKIIYDRYSRLVKAIVTRYLPDRLTGEEVFNDIFYRLFTKIHLYKPVGSFEGWLKKLAVNTILNHLKKGTQYKIYPMETIEQEVSIDPSVLGKFSQNELLKMIHNLPEPQRTVFNLYVFEGYRHKEIAAILGFKEINSKWHLNSARQKLKKQLNLSDE
jgi:RNA polymerase sigma-70 factor (ECF subfamily)